ncbi:uncharacterized protein LOC141902448 [Tubulanus polymorphus]|uniref:uncharacterized protein LOC141902448 n=1 Tax=Tubulanus polymorphus TaxID=672921 RepID=UPI003DA4A013
MTMESMEANSSIISLGKKADKQGLYHWQTDTESSLNERHEKLEKRRVEILNSLPDKSQLGSLANEDEKLVDEWITLVKERDVLLKRRIGKENDDRLNRHLGEIMGLFAQIDNLDTSSLKTSLRLSLIQCSKYVKEYCDHNDISAPSGDNFEPKAKKRKLDAAECSTDMACQTSPTAPSIIPIPPPVPAVPRPPPVPPPSVHLNVTPLSTRKLGTAIKNSVLSRRQSLPSTLTRKPLLGDELKKHITSGKTSLRSTPGIHSPGGTPIRQAKRYSIDDPTNLVTVALKKRFQNVIMKSPINESLCKSTSNDDSFGSDID